MTRATSWLQQVSELQTTPCDSSGLVCVLVAASTHGSVGRVRASSDATGTSVNGFHQTTCQMATCIDRVTQEGRSKPNSWDSTRVCPDIYQLHFRGCRTEATPRCAAVVSRERRGGSLVSDRERHAYIHNLDQLAYGGERLLWKSRRWTERVLLF